MAVSDNDPAGDLLIQEVDEDLRREQYHRLWRLYGKYVIAAGCAIILVVAGYQGWQSWRNNQRAQDGEKLGIAQDLITAGKTADALQDLAKIAQGNQAGFAFLANAQRAEILVNQGDTAGARAIYKDISASLAPAALRDLAKIKLAMLSLDEEDPAQLQGLLSPLAVTGNPWHFTATELLAVIAHRKGDISTAANLYKALADDPAAPQSVRARAAEMMAVMAPPPPPVTPSEKAKG